MTTLLLLSLVTSFKDDQLKFARVREAQKHVEAALRKRFEERGLAYPPREILLRAFKQDKQLEVWVKKDAAFVLLHSYAICASSGELGPKLQQGDGQVPEGLYTIDHFNPTSTYHLSLRVSYPNAADRARSTAKDLGGDIYVHGSCVTIGCMPLTDPMIEEVYWLAVLARDAGQRAIPIHIFPTRLTGEQTQPLWQQLKPFYEHFERTRTILPFVIDKRGAYVTPPARR